MKTICFFNDVDRTGRSLNSRLFASYLAEKCGARVVVSDLSGLDDVAVEESECDYLLLYSQEVPEEGTAAHQYCLGGNIDVAVVAVSTLPVPRKKGLMTCRAMMDIDVEVIAFWDGLEPYEFLHEGYLAVGEIIFERWGIPVLRYSDKVDMYADMKNRVDSVCQTDISG